MSNVTDDFKLRCWREFLDMFRISPEEIVLARIAEDIQNPTNRIVAFSPESQLLALHFVRNGEQYHDIADMHGDRIRFFVNIASRIVTVIVGQ